MDKKISIIDRFLFSFNPKKYIYLYKEKIGKAFLYILILSIILGGIQGIYSAKIISDAGKIMKAFLSQENTNFEMKDGILDFKEVPLKEEKGQVLLYIDTSKNLAQTNELKSITVHKEIAAVLLKDGIMVKQGSDEVKINYKDIGLGGLDFNNDILIQSFNIMSALKYLIIIFLIIFKFIELLFYALLVSVVGVLSNLMSNTKLKYAKILNVSLYAVTLPGIIGTIYPIGNLSILIGGMILMFALSIIKFDEYKDSI